MTRGSAPQPQSDKPETPDMSWTKSDIRDWLVARGIEYSHDDTKSELLELVP